MANLVSYRPPQTVYSRGLVYWYRARGAMRSVKFWWQTALLIGFWVLVGWPVYQTSLARGVTHTVLALVLAFGRARRYSGPNTIRQVEFEYLARKGRLYKLLRALQRREHLSAEQVADFQRETLQLIVSYVRGHRSDAQGTEIFANLLTPDGPDLVVIARNQDHRLPGARYPREGMVAWDAIQTGRAAVLGDLRKRSPEIAAVKPYRSILALPIYANEVIVGAVSIDSTRAHHFEAETTSLERYLAPYVCLLGWTLLEKRPTLSPSISSATAATDPEQIHE